MSLLKKLPWRRSSTNEAAIGDISHELNDPFSPSLGFEEAVTPIGAVMEADDAVDVDTSFLDEDPELLAADHKESRFRTFLNAIPKPSFDNGYQLLAFQSGSFGLRGGLIRNTRHGAILADVAESRDVDFTRAIAEVITQLKAHNKRLPKQAILITPSVISAMVDLPVSPLRPRSDSEMRELIKWELEGTLTQQNKHWLIGSMLVERGYLTASQRDELVEELKIRQSQGGQTGLLRFGDLAVQLNFISREQLEECFVLQGKLISVDDDLAYGWQAEEAKSENMLSDEALMSVEDDGDSAHKWLVCGMSKSVRRRWVGAFNLNGLKIQAFYPSIGSSFGLLSQQCADDEQALLEVHQEQLAFITGSADSVIDINVAEREVGAIRPDELKNLVGFMPSDIKKIFVNAPKRELEDIEFALSTVTTVQIEPVVLNRVEQQTALNIDPSLLIGILGAADHFLKHVPATRLSWIPAKEKEVAAYKKLLSVKVLICTLACVVVMAMLAFLGWMHWKMWQQTARLQALEERFDKDSKLKSQFRAIQSEQATLKVQIADALQEKQANKALLNQLSVQRIHDKSQIKLLLKSLSVSAPDTVFIEKVSSHNGEVLLTGFALSNTDGRLFVSTLNKALKPIQYEVISSDVSKSEDQSLPYVLNVKFKQRMPVKHNEDAGKKTDV